MLLEYTCPCDDTFGTRHRRDFAIEGNLTRTLTTGSREEHDWRRHAVWLTVEGPATRLWIDRVLVFAGGQWVNESARLSCHDRTDDYIEFLLNRPLPVPVPRERGRHATKA